MKRILIIVAASLALSLALLSGVPATAHAATRVEDAAALFGLSDYCVAEVATGGDINAADCRATDQPVIVHIPDGDYTVTSQLMTPAGRYLVAESGARIYWKARSGRLFSLTSDTGVYGGIWDLSGGPVQQAGNKTNAVFVYDGSKVTLANLTIKGSRGDGVQVNGKGGVVLDHVTISGSTFNGVLVLGKATIKDSTLTSNGKASGAKCSQPSGTGCSMVHGITVLNGASAAISNTKISKSQGYGVAAMNKASWKITGGTISASGRAGLYLETSSKGTASGVTIDKSKFNGVSIKNKSQLTLEKSTVKNSTRTGVYLESAAVAHFKTTTITKNGSIGLHISEAGKSGAKAYLGQGNKITSNKGIGISIGKGTRLAFTGKGNIIQANKGHGIYLRNKATVTGSSGASATVSKNGNQGISISKGTLTAYNLTITNNKKNGIAAASSATVRLNKCTIRGNASYAARADSKAKLTLTKCTIAGKTKVTGAGKITIKK